MKFISHERSSVVWFKLAFPDGEGRMGWGTKGPKQIRAELFLLFRVKLSSSGESGAHAPKGVHFLKELDRVDFFQGAARSYYFLSPSHKFPNDQDTI